VSFKDGGRSLRVAAAQMPQRLGVRQAPLLLERRGADDVL
jgi:hypothetical protein